MGLRQLLVGIVRRLAARGRHTEVPTSATSAMSRAMPTPLFVSWLDDARKLRPARPAPPTTVTLSRAALLRPMRFVADASRAAYRETGPTLGESGAPARQTQPLAHAPMPEPAPAQPELPVPDIETPDIDFLAASPEALANLTPEQRMLLRIRYLVRKGVYNEGFRANIPQQYRHSLGIDEPPTS